VAEAKLSEHEEWQKHVVLIFDEMHIKDLIFDKITEELKGFVNLDNINDHFLKLESSSWEQNKCCQKFSINIHGWGCVHLLI